ncbi:MAG: thermonuclease family protein [Elusimicrobia bacterium]|nr:thermonuclease family protein [Elusimicrobiota bacterium]
MPPTKRRPIFAVSALLALIAAAGLSAGQQFRLPDALSWGEARGVWLSQQKIHAPTPLLLSQENPSAADSAQPATPEPRVVDVIRAIDGDTVELSDGDRVRLIGVDTPELHHPRKPVGCYAKEAWEYTKARAEGFRARLVFDPANDSVRHRDKYGRLLAYLFLADGTFHNRELIAQGYGFAYTRFPYGHSEEFVAVEAEAKRQGKGLWSACPEESMSASAPESP